MTTRAYGRTSWPWAAVAVLLFWQTWFLCHVYATEHSAVRWICDSEGCGTNQLAGGALFLAAASALGAAVLAAPFLGLAGAGLATLLAAFGLLMGREDDHAVVAGHGLVALGAVLVVAGAAWSLRRRGRHPDHEGEGEGEGNGSVPDDSRVPVRALVLRVLAPGTLLVAVPAAVVVTALVHGALDGPRWVMMLGLNGTIALLFALGAARLRHRPGVALGPVSAAGAVHAPARLHSLTARGTDFVFDLTVLPEGAAPYRIEVQQPIDLQDVRIHRAALVRLDPRRPWLVDLPPHPPAAELARARAAVRTSDRTSALPSDVASAPADDLASDLPTAPRLRIPAPGTPVLLAGTLLTAVLLTALALA
ncbi:hypothetical protein [Streptomyces sp. NPDC056169]|uniref:hypothetical protein n=1 Tax=Streptomyces sp. NPDC056169 TaxID=3345734 RepID=UPI0035E1D580